MERCVRCQEPIADLGASFCPHCGQIVVRAPKPVVGPGTELDLGSARVVVGELLGEGGMGAVRHGWLYRADAPPTAPPIEVAVKLLHAALRSKPRARELFQREATALSRLDHPNIVRFHALLQHGPQLAIVMEYVSGQTLAQVLARHAPTARRRRAPCLEAPRLWHYFAQLLGALGACHQLGILHRDVKPGNLLIGPTGVCKLTDFGIARLPLADARVTTGMAPGTGAYMSPEQVMAHELDGRSDLYGAAILLYEMLTGVTPFDAPNKPELAIRAAQLDERPKPLSAHVEGLSVDLERVVARALAKRREDRYPSALQLGEAVRAALGLPDTPGWAAQRALALEARVISRLMSPLVSDPESQAGAPASAAPDAVRLPPWTPASALPVALAPGSLAPPGSVPPPGSVAAPVSMAPQGSIGAPASVAAGGSVPLPPPFAGSSPPGSVVAPSSVALPPPFASAPPPSGVGPTLDPTLDPTVDEAPSFVLGPHGTVGLDVRELGATPEVAAAEARAAQLKTVILEAFRR